jgi:hypothetical protein
MPRDHHLLISGHDEHADRLSAREISGPPISIDKSLPLLRLVSAYVFLPGVRQSKKRFSTLGAASN